MLSPYYNTEQHDLSFRHSIQQHFPLSDIFGCSLHSYQKTLLDSQYNDLYPHQILVPIQYPVGSDPNANVSSAYLISKIH